MTKYTNWIRQKIPSTEADSQNREYSNMFDKAVRATAPCTNAITMGVKNSREICCVSTWLSSCLLSPNLAIALNFSLSSSRSL
ncbi:hypothetical protein D1872_247730 [compost metagenome]